MSLAAGTYTKMEIANILHNMFDAPVSGFAHFTRTRPFSVSMSKALNTKAQIVVRVILLQQRISAQPLRSVF